MKKAAWLLEAISFIILSIPLAILPTRLSTKAGEIFGLLLFYLWESRRKIAVENLMAAVASCAVRITGSVDTIIRDNFKNIGRSFSELIKIYYGFGKNIIDSVEIEGIENFQSASSKGKGVLFITGHCGNWELMGIVLSAKYSKIAPIARPINNPYLNMLVERIREKYGNRVIYKKGALRPIIRILKENGCVGVLMDQAVLPDEGIVVEFLGRGAWTTKMPALVARKTNAAVLPFFIHRKGRGHKIEIFPAVEISKNVSKEEAVHEDTKTFSDYIENYVMEHPSEWLWIHRRWKRVK